MSDHLAIGPEAGNLLGFLASLGTLVVLDRVWTGDSVRLSWAHHRGAWRPVFHVPGQTTEDVIVDAISSELQRFPSPPGLEDLGMDLTVTPDTFRRFAMRAAVSAQPRDRRAADFAIAYGSEAVDNDGKIQDTAFRTMSGAGHQHFLGSMHELGRVTSREHIASALFEPWQYMDGRPSMRWDPVDDRRYAYRADDPATSTTAPIRTVRGANRLAIEALPLFPTAPRGNRLVTTGFKRIEPAARGGRTRWILRWPVWSPALPLSVVRSLLTYPGVVSDEADRKQLVVMGVVEIYEAERLTEGQFRNFTPARALLGGQPPACR